MTFIKVDNKYVNLQSITYIETNEYTKEYSPTSYTIQIHFGDAKPLELEYDTAKKRDEALEEIMSDIDNV